MKALLLAAGLGTRLKPFTFTQAKPVLPVLDVPFIRYALQYLYANGITEVAINLHSHPDGVRAVAGTEFQGMRIHYSEEPQILGTAGAIRKASSLLGDEPIVVMNGDILSDIPLKQVAEAHHRTHAAVTLVTMQEEKFRHYSGLYFRDQFLAGFQEGQGEKRHYSGIQIVSPEVVRLIPEGRKSEIFKDIYPQLASEQKIQDYAHTGLWMEIGTLNELLKTSLALQSGVLPEPLRPSSMAKSTTSHRATVEATAEIHDSVVMAGAVVKSGARVSGSIVGQDVTVTQNVTGVALARGFLPWYIL